MLRDINNIEIKEVIGLIPGILKNKIGKWNLYKIGDLFETTLDDFENKTWVGKKSLNALKELKNDILIFPEKYINESNKNKKVFIPLKEEISTKNFIESIEIFFNEYYLLKRNNRNTQIFMNRFGFDKNEKTLNEIGKIYGLSYEAIRLIINKEIKILRDLFFNEQDKNVNNIKCRPFLLKKISSLGLFLNDRIVISRHEIMTILKLFEKNSLSGYYINYLNAIMKILNYEKIKFLQNDLYYKSNLIDFNTLKEILILIFQILRINCHPISLKDIVNKVDKLKVNFNSKEKITTEILESVQEFEKVEKKNIILYQIRFDKLSSLSEMAVRILSEKNEVMHREDICKEVNLKLSELKSDRIKANSENIKKGLVKNGEAIPIGKTGYWSLREWNVNSDSISELIEECLREQKKALSIKEIFYRINKKRIDLKYNSLASTIAVYKNKFVKLRNKKIILKKWSNNYFDEI